jgi:hypothetical protein
MCRLGFTHQPFSILITVEGNTSQRTPTSSLLPQPVFYLNPFFYRLDFIDTSLMAASLKFRTQPQTRYCFCLVFPRPPTGQNKDIRIIVQPAHTGCLFIEAYDRPDVRKLVGNNGHADTGAA